MFPRTNLIPLVSVTSSSAPSALPSSENTFFATPEATIHAPTGTAPSSSFSWTHTAKRLLPLTRTRCVWSSPVPSPSSTVQENTSPCNVTRHKAFRPDRNELLRALSIGGILSTAPSFMICAAENSALGCSLRTHSPLTETTSPTLKRSSPIASRPSEMRRTSVPRRFGFSAGATTRNAAPEKVTTPLRVSAEVVRHAINAQNIQVAVFMALLCHIIPI